MNGSERAEAPVRGKEMWVVWDRPGVRIGYATASPEDIATGMCTFIPIGGQMVRTTIWSILPPAQRAEAEAKARTQRLDEMHRRLTEAGYSLSAANALPMQGDIVYCGGCGGHNLAIGRDYAADARGCNECGRVFRKRPAPAAPTGYRW